MPGKLDGARVLVTRSAKQSADLVTGLERLGAAVHQLPMIEIRPLHVPTRVLAQLEANAFAWVVLTSVNSAELFLTGLRAAHPRFRVAAIGTATAAECEKLGFPPDLVPPAAHGDALLAALVQHGVQGATILIPRARVARDVLPDGLRAAGAHVEVVPIYETVQTEEAAVDLRALLVARSIDVVTFTSGSTVEAFSRLLDGTVPTDVAYACIGPVTAHTAAEFGYTPVVTAEPHNIAGLMDAIARYWESKGLSR